MRSATDLAYIRRSKKEAIAVGIIIALVKWLETKAVGTPPAAGKGKAGQDEPPTLRPGPGAGEPGQCEPCTDQGRTRAATTVWEGETYDVLVCDEHVKVFRKVVKRPTRAYQGEATR